MRVKIQIDRDSAPLGALARLLANRRFAGRKDMRVQGEIEWISEGQPFRMAALVTNVSDRGASLKVDSPLKKGYRAVLWVDGQPAEAEVRHCKRKGDDYVVGLLFGEDQAPVRSADLYWRSHELNAPVAS